MSHHPSKPRVGHARALVTAILCGVIACPAGMLAQQSCPDPRGYVQFEPPLLAAYAPVALKNNGPWAPTDCVTTADASSPCSAHMVYVPSQKSGVVRRQPLVVFLPGTAMEPRRQTLVLRMAAYAGYRTIGLSYDNQEPIEGVCSGTAKGANCHGKARLEAVTGLDVSSDVTVHRGDGVLHRLYNLLVELHRQDLRDGVNDYGWNQYYRPHNNAMKLTMANIRFDRIIIAGFSQGGGHAAFISKTVPVVGTVMIDAPFDTAKKPDNTEVPADWLQAPGDASAGQPRYGLGYAHPFIQGPPYTTLDNWQLLGLNALAEDLDLFVQPPVGQAPPPPLDAGYTLQREVNDPSCSTHASMAKDGCLPTTFLSRFPAIEPNDVHLFEPYLLRFCYACPSGMCP